MIGSFLLLVLWLAISWAFVRGMAEISRLLRELFK